MQQLYAELTIHQEASSWYFDHCPAEFIHMTGFSHQEIQTKFSNNFLAFFTQNDAFAINQCLLSLPDKAIIFPRTYDLRNAFGQTIRALLQAEPIQWGIEKEYMRIAITDVAPGIKQASALGARLESLENSYPGGLCQMLMNEELTVIWHNNHFLNLIGYTKQQFIQELQGQAKRYVHPEDIAIVHEQFAAINGRIDQPTAIEIRIIRRNGEIRTLIATFGFTGETYDGVPIFYSSEIDITDNKLKQQLKLEAERFQFAMEQTSSCVWEYNLLSRKILASESLQKLLALTGDIENVPDSLLEAGIIHTDSQEQFQQLFEAILNGAKKATCTVRMQNGRKEYIWVKISMIAVCNDASKATKAIALMEDITERYELELRYREEENRRMVMNFDQQFAGQLNLSENTVLDINNKAFPSYRERFRMASTLIRQHADNWIHPNDREAYLKAFSKEDLVTSFEHGISEITLEYRTFIQGNDYRWQQASAHIIREPAHGELWSYFYIEDIDERKTTELELRKHAERDGLTDLFNRYTTELKCRQYLQSSHNDQLSALLFLDLDGFKNVNDCYGHTFGDEILRKMATILRQSFCDENALIGRMGGDEFLVFLPQYLSVDNILKNAQGVCTALYDELGETYGVSVSMGISLFPLDGLHFEELYQCADTALYQAKRLGKNRCVLYEKSLSLQDMQKKQAVSRDWLLAESNDIIYVADFYSYDMLYMNNGAKNLFRPMSDNYKEKKCFQILHNVDKPCSFCTNHLLSRDSFYTWRYCNPIINKTFQLKDRIVDWYGRPARIEFATDITEVDSQSKLLEGQVQLDRAIIDCYRSLNNSIPLDKAVYNALGVAGDFYQADRLFILTKNLETGDYFVQYLWVGQTVTEPQFDKDDLDYIIKMLAEHCRNESCYKMNEHNTLEQTDPTLYHIYQQNDIFAQRFIPYSVEQTLMGFIGMDNPRKSCDELTMLETLGGCLAEQLSRQQLSNRLTFLGSHDALTGLLNRNSFAEYMEKLFAHSLFSLGVIMADLNALGEINRLHGHIVGDLVVKNTAALLKKHFPEQLIYRLNGDEFLAFYENCSKKDFLARMACIQEGSQELNATGISIGYAWSDQKSALSQLFTRANEMMLIRKQIYYQTTEQKFSSGKHQYNQIHTLLDSIKQGHFKLYLQPKVNCMTEKVTGAEALARYDSPQAGFKIPLQFIPEMEQNYTIKYLDLFIFEEVCCTLARWKKEGRPPLTISLNLSRLTLLEPGLMHTIQNITDSYGVPRNLIELEITESLGIYENKTIAEIGADIKGAGFQLALDDFGSQYTNMSILILLPPDTLKIDRSLVQDLLGNHSNKILLQHLFAFCREMNIQSVMEGVENEEQLALLRSLRCDEIQGYLFGKPVPIKVFEQCFF